MGEVAQWVKSVATETGGAGYVSPSPITPLKGRHGTSVCHAGAFIGGRETQTAIEKGQRDLVSIKQGGRQTLTPMTVFHVEI